MNKKEFIREVSYKAGVTIKDTELVVSQVFDSIKEIVMERGEDLLINSFGKFIKREFKPRKIIRVKDKKEIVTKTTYKIFLKNWVNYEKGSFNRGLGNH